VISTIICLHGFLSCGGVVRSSCQICGVGYVTWSFLLCVFCCGLYLGRIWIFNTVVLDTTLHVCMAGLVVMVIDWNGGGVNLFYVNWLFEGFHKHSM
jgi:hypothetical protein